MGNLAQGSLVWELSATAQNLTFEGTGTISFDSNGRLPEGPFRQGHRACGDVETISRLREKQIKDGSFFTDGCGAAGFAGALALMLAVGKTLMTRPWLR